MPESLRVGGDFREAYFSNQVESAPVQQQFITMRADLYADIKVGRFRAAGSIGYVPQGDLQASLTRAPETTSDPAEHWLGVELDEDGAWLLRAGRIALPVRHPDDRAHALGASVSRGRTSTQTQQYGLALSLSEDKLRMEVMAIAGNFRSGPTNSASAATARTPNTRRRRRSPLA